MFINEFDDSLDMPATSDKMNSTGVSVKQTPFNHSPILAQKRNIIFH